MSKKGLLLIGAIGLILLAIWALLLNKSGTPQNISPASQSGFTKPTPYETLKEYTDPSGFSFSYPDNLSITNNEIEDPNTYADLQLYVNGVNGSLNLKISDSKLKSIGDWVESVSSGEAAKEVKLGSLEAMELKLTDRLLLGALDQGVLFTIEVPLVEEDFWMQVYNKILTSFSFVAPQADSKVTTGSTGSDVIFEGEEIVE